MKILTAACLLIALTATLTFTDMREKEQATIDSSCNEKTLMQAIQSTPAIAIGEIVRVEPSMGVWSGYFPVVQRVHYKVKELLKGEVPDTTINVAHFIVANSAFVDTAKPQLSTAIFKEGNSFVLFLEPDPKKGYLSSTVLDDKVENQKTFLSSDQCGVISAKEENVAAIKSLIRNQRN